jgi:hypothetical protein
VTSAYETLLKEDHPPVQFWQTPVFLVGGLSASFGFGALLVGTHCFGLIH